MQETFISSDYRLQLADKIIALASKAFRAKGIKAVKMDDLAGKLGISKRTLYEIFENKEDLLLECMKKENKDFRSHMAAIQKNKKLTVIDLMIETYRYQLESVSKTSPYYLTDIRKYPKIVEWLDAVKAGIAEEGKAYFDAGVKEGYFRDDIDFSLISQMGDAAREYILSRQLFRKYSLKKIFHDIVLLYMRGMLTVKGMEMFDPQAISIDG